MRKIISLSIPASIQDSILKDIKNFGYATQSEFFRDIYRQWKEKVFIPELQIIPKKLLTKKRIQKAKKILKVDKNKLNNL